MTTRKRLRVAAAAAGLLVLTLVSCTAQTEQDAQSHQRTDSSRRDAPHVQDSLVIELGGRDSLTVLDVLLLEHEADFKRTALGVFVQAIDSVPNARGFFWLYSVNDSTGQVSCDRHVTKDGDVIRWYFRRVER